MALIYEFYAGFENIDESSRFKKLSKQELREVTELLTFNSEKLLDEWIDFINEHINEFVAELCTSYMVGAEQISPGYRHTNNLYASFLIVKGDIYTNPGAADIFLSMTGYTGRSGKLTFKTLVEHFELHNI
jgi:hypothetical protein